MNQNLFPKSLLVELSGDQVFTTSLKVAEHFQKRHDHVLRDIQKLTTELSDSLPNFGERITSLSDFSRRNFAERKYQYLTAKNQSREAPMYVLTNVQTINSMDIGTTHDDYSADVWARARFYAGYY